MVDVHSVSAGGGSIAWVDEGGALRVGPASAGADPGPAAYGKGGTAATVAVANAEMTRALRVMSVERGIDPRELTLVAFGGAGGLHACALAEELGIARVLAPRAAGVLSALGLAISDVRLDHVRPFLAALEHADPAEV